MILKKDRRHVRSGRARRIRMHIRELSVYRLSVHRTPRHIYAQIISPDGARTLASASTVDTMVRREVGNGGNRAAATVVGRVVAERARVAGIERVAFDRSGFKYHGRVQALAEAAREAGLQF